LCTGKFLFSSNSRIMPYFGTDWETASIPLRIIGARLLDNRML
jgi:hypothetical protein